SSEKFVVSLEGRWGSGKTTFLNNLIEEVRGDDFIIIDDFEPWLSESKESLLRNLLNTILMQSNLDISRREIDIFIKITSELVLGKKYVNPIINVIENIEQNHISNITSDINYMIDRQGKKILFVIDNLDRLKPDSVYLVLNIVNNILNFHNLIVILSYDRDELENGLKSINISSKYLDKIVQQKLVMPPVKKSDRNNIYSRAIKNLLDSKNIEYNIEEVNKFSEILSDNQVGLRDFKRFLNSSIIPFVLNSRKIAIIDYLVIEFIRIYDGTLYEDIYRNPSYFISSDIGWENSFKYVNSKEIDQEMNDLFKNIGIEDNLTGKLLQFSFPFVENYLKYKANYKNTINDSRNNPVYQNIQKNKRISSGKFFDLYFTKDTNPDANMIDLVSNFVEKHQTEKYIQYEIDLILGLDEDVQIEYLPNLSLYVEEMSSKQRYIRGKLFLKNYFRFEDFKGFLTLNTRNRLALVISELLEGSEQNEFENIFHDYIFEPKYLTMVSDIRYWLEHSVRRDNKEKLEYIDAEFKDSIERILSQKVNLFEGNRYIRLNALQIYFYLEKTNASSRYKEYLQNCMNEETYFRILSDLVGITEGSQVYSYAMRDNFENMVDVDLLKNYNERVESINERQDLLKKVFENQLSGIKDEYDNIAIHLNESIDLSMVD
ncbi:MAG: KAP family NTPase, partial [Bacillota bacterium]|nr:KAP family NTPase [Bacillota bacterium]